MTSGNEGGGASSDSLEGAIDIFATLLEESRKCGETSFNSALCYYEYGNALFRSVVRQKPLDIDGTSDNDDDGDKKPAAKPAAANFAARKRSLDDVANTNNMKEEPDSTPSNKKAKLGDDGVDENNKNNDDDDITLALDMLSTSFSIFDLYTSFNDVTKKDPDDEEKKVSTTQIPRILSTIGDIHSYRGKFEDAVDAYCRALPYREKAVEKQVKGESSSVEDLKCQRLLVETYALIAEALIACKEGEDIVCVNDEEDEDAKMGNKKVLVAAKDQLDFADSHYNTAREKLQDIGMLII